MSQLVVKGHKGKEFKLNCTQFRSPMSAAVTTVQTRKMLQHFPVRAGQPDINFTVKFRSQDDKHKFQAFVRDHQINAQTETGDLSTAVKLWWPERNIENWSGYIVEFKVNEKGFREVAPSVTFGVALIESLMSEHTKLSSFYGSILGWQSIWGPQIPAYRGPGPLDVDNILRPPTPPSASNPETSSPSGGSSTPNTPPLVGGGGSF